MSSLCKLARPIGISAGVCCASNISKVFPGQRLLFYSSKARDTGSTSKSGSKSSWSFVKKGDKGRKNRSELWGCMSCPPSQGNPCSPSMYDQRKYGHNLPKNDVNMCFEPLPQIPTGVFRNTDSEMLGLGAGKCCIYKNPEYFSFHHMTYYDMHLNLRCHRKPCPKTGRKP